MCASSKTPKLRATAPLWGNPLVTGGLMITPTNPQQNVSRANRNNDVTLMSWITAS